MRTLGVVFLLLPSCTFGTRLARACQDPPNVPCDLTPAVSVVSAGESFDVIFTMTNLGIDPTTGFPLPAADDLDFTIEVSAGGPFGGGCNRQFYPLAMSIDPPGPLQVQLDDAWSPAADEPTTFRQVFRVTPLEYSERYMVTVRAYASDPPTGGGRSCTVSACVSNPPPDAPPQPWAAFVEPVQSGDGGEHLPFDLMVHRDGYDPSHPLRVAVVPTNASDPIDIFPMTPPELADTTRGVIVTGEDEIVHFECHCHFPCFVGASNLYRVYIYDDVTDVRLWSSSYVGKALVDRAPLALLELVDIVDASGNGALEACEPGQIHLRLIGRHPFANVPMDDMRLDLPLPAGVTPSSWSLHFHDNPMDAVVPLPAELTATGTVTPGPTNFVVETSRVAYRYETVPSRPAVFQDMFEVELLLDVAPGALAQGSLDFAGFRVDGMVSGIPRFEVAPTVSLAIGPGSASEVSAPGRMPLRMQPDKETLTWDGGVSPAFNVYKGEIASLPRYGDCLQSNVPAPRFTDPDPLPASRSVFYLVTASGCGIEGPLGPDSAGAARYPGTPCP